MPPCTCTSFWQMHSCGCPDSQRANGLPGLSLRPCEFHSYPLLVQELAIWQGYRCRRVHDPRIVVLPFPCARHNEETTLRFSKQEMRALRAAALRAGARRPSADRVEKQTRERHQQGRRAEAAAEQLLRGRRPPPKVRRTDLISPRHRIGPDDGHSRSGGGGGGDVSGDDSYGRGAHATDVAKLRRIFRDRAWQISPEARDCLVPWHTAEGMDGLDMGYAYSPRALGPVWNA